MFAPLISALIWTYLHIKASVPDLSVSAVQLSSAQSSNANTLTTTTPMNPYYNSTNLFRFGSTPQLDRSSAFFGYQNYMGVNVNNAWINPYENPLSTLNG
jgi:hypothetical protein